MTVQTARDALDAYIVATNTHDFDQVAELLVDEPVYFFGDANVTGGWAVREYFERTWSAIPDEEYWVESVEWPVDGHDGAVAVYRYRWRGTVEGRRAEGSGRATNAFARTSEGWRLAHEHLSREP